MQNKNHNKILKGEKENENEMPFKEVGKKQDLQEASL